MALDARTAIGRPLDRLRMSVEEYLAFEALSDERHEYAGGWVYPLHPGLEAMAGGTNNHAALAGNVAAALHLALERSTCLVYSPDVRVQVDPGTYRYPDVAVSCDSRDLAAGEERHIAHPCALVEVLSETTEAVDRGDKLAEYRSLPSVQDYLLVNHRVRRIEHYRRAGDLWIYRTYGPGEAVALGGLAVELAVDAVYAKVRLASDPPPGATTQA